MTKISHFIKTDYRFFRNFTSLRQAPKNAFKLNLKDYSYHSIGGFDLFKIASIMTHGILSKYAAQQKGITLDTDGFGYNGEHHVSVATSEVLHTECYAGNQLSIVMDSSCLSFLNPSEFMPPDEIEEALYFEKQVYGSIPKENIVGIMIPNNYLFKRLADIPIFLINHHLERNFINLNHFFEETFTLSLFSDSNIKQYYEEALALQKALQSTNPRMPGESLIDCILRQSKQEKQIKRCYRDTTKIESDLNKSIMEFIIRIFSKKTAKPDLNIVDILHKFLEPYSKKHQELRIWDSCGNPLEPTYRNSHVDNPSFGAQGYVSLR